MDRRTELQKAIARGLRPGGDLSDELDELEDYSIERRCDATAICNALRQFPRACDRESRGHWIISPLHALTSLFQDVGSEESYEVLSEQGLPELLRVYDTLNRSSDSETADLLFILKIFAMYRYDDGIERIIAAANHPWHSDGYLWSAIFSQFDAEDDYSEALCEALRDPLPQNFARVAFLDWINQIARDGDCDAHPFNSPAGWEQFNTWLSSSNPEDFSFAHSAAAALPFLSPAQRPALLALAHDHLCTEVQMEAAWASSWLGSEAGIRILQRHCLDARTAAAAQEYLEELGREDAVPDSAYEADFQAMAEMCQWLSHPSEYGRPPDQIEVFDSRELYWPPTDDYRRVWLCRYLYEPDADEAAGTDDVDAEPEVGIGMIGSVTFVLFDEETDHLSADDIYALHCCWELEMNRDPRAPANRSIEEGRRILEEYGS